MADDPHPVDPEAVSTARASGISQTEADDLHDLLNLIGEPVRARVLAALVAAQELCVGDVALALDISQDAASYALRVLREQGLVQRRTEGRMGFYRLADGPRREPLRNAVERLAQLTRVTEPP